MAGEESVSASKMGVQLLLFTAFLMFVVFNVIWGQNISRNFEARMDKTEEQSLQKYFNQASMAGGVNMPMAGAYSMVEYNYEDVGKMYFKALDNDVEKKEAVKTVNSMTLDNQLYWMRTNLTGRCNVKASRNDEGTWDLIVSLLKDINN